MYTNNTYVLLTLIKLVLNDKEFGDDDDDDDDYKDVVIVDETTVKLFPHKLRKLTRTCFIATANKFYANL